MSDAVKLVCMTCGQMNRLALAKLVDGPRCGACGDALLTGKVAEMDRTAHDKATGGDGLALLVDYWAPWCGPCRRMAPEFAKAAKGLEGRVRFAKINTQDHPKVSERLRIQGIPLLILWQDGRELARLAGARPAAEIAAFVEGRLGTRG